MKSTSSLGLLLLRVSFGGAMLFGHGWSKLTGFTILASQFPDPLGIGSTASLGLTVFAEFFCSLFVMLGILTRWSSVPLIITMAVAALVIHGTDPFSTRELSLLYLCGFSSIWLLGPGSLSVDQFFLGKRS